MIPPLGVIDKSVVISSSRKEGSERNRHKLKTCNNTLKSNGDNAANWSIVSSDQESDVTRKNGVAFVVGISHVGNWECIIGLGAIALSTLMKVSGVLCEGFHAVVVAVVASWYIYGCGAVAVSVSCIL